MKNIKQFYDKHLYDYESNESKLLNNIRKFTKILDQITLMTNYLKLESEIDSNIEYLNNFDFLHNSQLETLVFDIKKLIQKTNEELEFKVKTKMKLIFEQSQELDFSIQELQKLIEYVRESSKPKSRI